jgi:hypothetical protein
VTVPDNANLDLPGDFTIEAWAKPASSVGSEQVVVGKAKSAQTRFWQYRLGLTASNQWYGAVYVNKTTYQVVAPGTADPSHWDHIAMTRSGNTLPCT